MLWNFLTGEKLREYLYELFSKYSLVNSEIRLMTCNQQFFNGLKWNRLENRKLEYITQARLSIILTLWLQLGVCVCLCILRYNVKCIPSVDCTKNILRGTEEL